VSDWTYGYVAEIGYTYGYYGELNPLRIALPFLNVGLAPPEIATACELGFGQGVSANIHAAASDIAWYGTDFNPTHAAFAQSLAATAGSGARLFDQSFAEFCARSDLPDFDFIALHGIWSWISEANQRVIVEFIQRKLKVGGVLYISYNCQPGHAAMVPLQKLLAQHAGTMGASGHGLVARIDAAVDFAQQLLALNPVFTIANPTIVERLNTIKGHDRHYLAHEYFNRDWQTMAFSEMARSLASAKLTYACSAHYLDHIDALNMTADQQQFLAGIPDPMFRQSVRDFIVNQQFRRDYWVKGARRLSPLEQAETLKRLRVSLINPVSDVVFTVQGAIGQRELNADVYNPILELLGGQQSTTIGDIDAKLSGTGVGLPAVYEAAMVLAGKGDLALVQSDERQHNAKPRTDKLNRWVLDRARGSNELTYLASPVTGGAIGVARFYQLFLLAQQQGRQGADDLARFAWDILGSQGQRVIKDGKTLESADENIAELAAQAREFVDKRLSVLRAMQIAD
jgi:SAM-dependent methyltransferase